jgi:hypothetical protein
VAGSVVVKAKVDESTQVDRGASVSEPDLVADNAAVADPTTAVADEPGDGPFDHWSVLLVWLDKRLR